MAYIEEGLYTLLSGTVAIAALVSTRIYAVVAPQNPTTPFLVVTKISDVPEYVMGSESGITTARIQIDAYDTTYSGARALSEAVRQALSHYSGAPYGVTVDIILKESDTALWEDEVKLHRILNDYMVSYRQSAPAI